MSKRFYRATEVVGALVFLWMIGVLLVDIFGCTPVRSFWKIQERKHCVNTKDFYYGVAITNIITDFMILCLPGPMIWRLHLSIQRKISLTVVFMLGGL